MDLAKVLLPVVLVFSSKLVAFELLLLRLVCVCVCVCVHIFLICLAVYFFMEIVSVAFHFNYIKLWIDSLLLLGCFLID